jgi:hypothetical protein
LTEDLAQDGLKRGDVGTVVLCHDNVGYEVEFVSLKGGWSVIRGREDAPRRPPKRFLRPRELEKMRNLGRLP